MRVRHYLFMLFTVTWLIQGPTCTYGLSILTKDVQEAAPGINLKLYCDYRAGPEPEAISKVAVDWDKADVTVEYGWKSLCSGGHGVGIIQKSISPQKYLLDPSGSDLSLEIRNFTETDQGVYRCIIAITTTTGMQSEANSTVDLKLVRQNTNDDISAGDKSALMLPSIFIIFMLSFFPAVLSVVSL